MVGARSHARQRVFFNNQKVSTRFTPPDATAIELVESELTSLRNQQKLEKKVEFHAERLQAGLTLLRQAAQCEVTPSAPEVAKRFLGDTKFFQAIRKLITNSLRADHHFLPADEQDAAWTCIETHSLVLFRYTFTLPVTVLDSASDIRLPDWSNFAEVKANQYPVLRRMTERPIKRLRLKPAFLSDLITRYVSMHIRLGSPDFTEDRIGQYISQVETQ